MGLRASPHPKSLPTLSFLTPPPHSSCPHFPVCCPYQACHSGPPELSITGPTQLRLGAWEPVQLRTRWGGGGGLQAETYDTG